MVEPLQQGAANDIRPSCLGATLTLETMVLHPSNPSDGTRSLNVRPAKAYLVRTRPYKVPVRLTLKLITLPPVFTDLKGGQAVEMLKPTPLVVEVLKAKEVSKVVRINPPTTESLLANSTTPGCARGTGQ